MDAASVEGVSYTINGTKVVFPFKAYPTQLCMMDKIIKGLERRQHSLLESPTGSGKSVALLCSCLVWQGGEYEKRAKEESEENQADNCDNCCEEIGVDPSDQTGATVNPVLPAANESKGATDQQYIEEEDEKHKVTTPNSKEAVKPDPSSTPLGSPTDDDFQPAKKRFRAPGNPQSSNIRKRRKIHTLQGTVIEEEYDSDHEPPQWDMEVTSSNSKESSSPGTNDSAEKNLPLSIKSGENKAGKKRTMVPKIYFGTRTHKQIAQLSRELNKTFYKHAKMTILSSRDHSCVHPGVSKSKNKNEECGKLMDSSVSETCRYYHRVQAMKTQSRIRQLGLHIAWDIEDLLAVGRRVQACPYYAARELVKDSDIIFCPYNYLIDPLIRKQLDINLKDQVVILDEAHNIEDCCRETASLKITDIQLQEVIDDIDKLVSIGVLPDHHRPLHLLCASMLRWIHESSGELKETGFEQASKVLSGEEIVKTLQRYGITPATMTLFKKHYVAAVKASQDPSKPPDTPHMSVRSTSFLQAVFLILGEYLLGHDMKHISDYRVAILKTTTIVRANELSGNWRRARATRKEWTLSLNFWCMNPAVVFSELGSMVRSIILTSGTLSPMTSFCSELGVSFPIKLEANHVIAKSQVWAGTLLVGPSGAPINASYRYAETFNFQDEVGRLVQQICEVVPHGVLCFFPSYNMLEKLSKRWQATGLWSQMQQKKLIVVEPRRGDKLEFDNIMHQFYHAVRVSSNEEEEDSDEEESSVEGALFLAVCRGKVSEGLDFADNNARAVITIGIPFPNIKDIQVVHKRKYNNQYASSRGLLTGNEWYEIQAFRALNQALGRCIRHKKDWGAILVVDERFKSPKYTNGLSKWLRSKLQCFNNFPAIISSLAEFTRVRQIDPCPTPSTQTMNNSWIDHSFTALQNTTHTPATISRTTSKTNATPGHAISYAYPGHLSEVNKVTDVATPSPTVNVNITPKVLSFDSPVGVNEGKAKRSVVAAEITKTDTSTELNGSSRDVVVDDGDPQSTVDRDATTQDSQALVMEPVGRNQESSTGQHEVVSEFPGSPLLFTTPCSSAPPSPQGDNGVTDGGIQERAAQGLFDAKTNGLCREGSAAYHLLEGNKEKAVVGDQIVQDGVLKDVEKPDPSGKLHATNGVNAKVPRPDPPRRKHPTTRSLFTGSKASVTQSQAVTGNMTLSRNSNHIEDAKSDSSLPEEEMKKRSISSELKPDLSCSKTRGRNSPRSIKQEGSDDTSVSTRVIRSNLRRSCKRRTGGTTCNQPSVVADCVSKKGGADESNAQMAKSCAETENERIGEHITCARCGTLLLTGRTSRQRKRTEFLQKLFEPLNPAINKSKTEEHEVLVVNKSSALCNIRYFGSSSKGLNLNSLYVPGEECCYVPQMCAHCSVDKPNKPQVVGIEVISFKSQLLSDDQAVNGENPRREKSLYNHTAGRYGSQEARTSFISPEF